MFIMYNHIISFFILFMLSLFSLLLLMIIINYSCYFYMNFNFLLFSNFELSMEILLDIYSLSFSIVVLLISSIISLYSYYYMYPYNKSYFFLWVKILFVFSMLLVIFTTNLFYVMLGWDGLGLISFFLIVYYQSSSSIFSGIFTIMMNRLGDCFFIIWICMSMEFYSMFSMTHNFFILSILMLMAFMSKSAIFPFSPWLPLAMAAPTPISALVHSSTLVTAGLYLMLRFYDIYIMNFYIYKFLLLASIFTSFYAGLNTFVEFDMKKLVALSTLSHMGFMGMSYCMGLHTMMFFHLLTHAIFKSVLFMSLGNIIYLSHSQDMRYLSMGLYSTPSSSFIALLCCFNLLGIPSLSGFFSKDLVLEFMNFSNCSFFILFIMYMNVFFTYWYTYKIIYYMFSTNKLYSYQILINLIWINYFMMILLILLTLLFHNLFTYLLNPFLFFCSIPFIIKFMPLILMISMFMFIFMFMGLPMPFKLVNYFNSMMFLNNILLYFSKFYFYNLFNFYKFIEIGVVNNTMNYLLPTFF